MTPTPTHAEHPRPFGDARPLLVTAMLLLAFFGLTACAPQATPEDVGEVVRYLEALNAGDLDAARTYICEERADDILTLTEAGGTGGITFENIECEARGADVVCTYNVLQEVNDVERQRDRRVTFELQNGQICGFEEEVETQP